jgi:predicted nucleotidyltransferase
MNELMQVTNEYELITYELKCLFEQDNYGDFKEEADWLQQEQTVSQAHSMIKKVKTNQSDRRSRSHSHHSRRSSSSTSSYTRLNAPAEAAAACESAEYEQVMARKEHDCRQRELEHAKEMAILIADKKVAIANPKLKAIEEALQEGELGESQYSRNSRWELRRGRMTG